MDFTKALAVLQSRAGQPLAPEHGGVNADANAPTAANTPSSQQQCLACDEAAQQEQEQLGQARGPVELQLLSVGGLLRLFMERQERRVAIYRRFEEGFTLFLQVAEATGYQALVASITSSFAEISESVNKVEAELRERGGAALPHADTIRSVQKHEKEKLQITAQLQILRHGLAIDENQRESEDDAVAAAAARTHKLRSDEAAELRQRLTQVTSAIGEALDEIRAELVDGELEQEEVESL